MKKELEILCEIIFTDDKLGYLTSRIGRVEESQLKKYSINSKNFIIFKERYNSPIPNSAIKEIIIHQDHSKKLRTKEVSKLSNQIKIRNIGKIS